MLRPLSETAARARRLRARTQRIAEGMAEQRAEHLDTLWNLAYLALKTAQRRRYGDGRATDQRVK